MSQSIENKDSVTVKKKIGRPNKNRTKQEFREFLRLRSREYYANPVNKEKQRLKMIEYRNRNKDKINAKKRAKRSRDKLEKNLKRIWSTKGLI